VTVLAQAAHERVAQRFVIFDDEDSHAFILPGVRYKSKKTCRPLTGLSCWRDKFFLAPCSKPFTEVMA
jgi:hypothetical protein